MGLSAPGIAITVVTGFLVAAVVVVLAGYLVVNLLDLVRTRRVPSPLEQIEAEYQATRRAMNDAANQSWRNLID